MNRENCVTLIVQDNCVYIGGRSIYADLSSLAADGIRAVQWQEKYDGVGHLEMEDGVNVSIDAAAFARFIPIEEKARAYFAEIDAAEAQRLADEELARTFIAEVKTA